MWQGMSSIGTLTKDVCSLVSYDRGRHLQQRDLWELKGSSMCWPPNFSIFEDALYVKSKVVNNIARIALSDGKVLGSGGPSDWSAFSQNLSISVGAFGPKALGN